MKVQVEEGKTVLRGMGRLKQQLKLMGRAFSPSLSIRPPVSDGLFQLHQPLLCPTLTQIPFLPVNWGWSSLSLLRVRMFTWMPLMAT